MASDLHEWGKCGTCGAPGRVWAGTLGTVSARCGFCGGLVGGADDTQEALKPLAARWVAQPVRRGDPGNLFGGDDESQG